MSCQRGLKNWRRKRHRRWKRLRGVFLCGAEVYGGRWTAVFYAILEADYQWRCGLLYRSAMIIMNGRTAQ